METIKVNMSPNPLDVQTIHASQNDGEARQWEFELHNNGELIDTSEVTEQMFFKSYKGGTEQILPENGAVPVTAPFVGDIKYPDATRTDQEFLYRQSPTEEDGLAKITDIKGNTLVWNQLYQNTNITTSKTKNEVTITNNNDGSWTLSGTASATTVFFGRNGDIKPILDHKYLLKDCVPNGVGQFYCDYGNVEIRTAQNNSIVTATSTTAGNGTGLYILSGATVDATFRPQIFDLTQMGLDISNPSDFTSLFPLPYYAYNQGTLLSFNGNGIKTTGKNLLKTNISSETINGVTFTVNKDENGVLTEIIVSGTATQRANLYVLPQGTNNVLSTGRYILSCGFDSHDIYMSSYNTSTGLSYRVYGSGVEVPYVTGEYYSIYISVLEGATANNIIFKPMLRLADVEDATFEPYTSSTLSLPISTYFTNGMKSAGSVYDEKTNSSYVERTAYIKFDGSQPWSTRTTSGGSVLYEFVPPDIKNVGTQATAQISNNLYPWNTNLSEDKTIRQVNTTISVRRDDITSLQAWYSELASNPLEVVYQLATPIETEITTASLVTENAEIPLSNEDGTLIGKCTEELSAEPGFHDAKIKLSDSDGECYSNKIQLHVERSPQ